MSEHKDLYRYTKAATEALFEKRYSWPLAKAYVNMHGNEGKNLDPVMLDKAIQRQQDVVGWMALVSVGIVVFKPVKWIVKRKLKKCRKAR